MDNPAWVWGPLRLKKSRGWGHGRGRRVCAVCWVPAQNPGWGEGGENPARGYARSSALFSPSFVAVQIICSGRTTSTDGKDWRNESVQPPNGGNEGPPSIPRSGVHRLWVGCHWRPGIGAGRSWAEAVDGGCTQIFGLAWNPESNKWMERMWNVQNFCWDQINPQKNQEFSEYLICK